MRSVATVLCWLVATVAVAVAIPAGWAQRNLIDQDGYAGLARSAASDPAVQSAMASELTAQVVTIAGSRGLNLNDSPIRGVATAYTAGPSFPGQFAEANRIAHRWMFTEAVRQSGDRLTLDLAPMLSDTSFKQTLSNLRIPLPSSVSVPVTSDTMETLRPGQLRPLATWGPWISIGAAVLAVVAALLTVAVAKARGKALVALGISALLVGGTGWAAVEIGRRYIDDALNQTTDNVRTIADVMVTHAEGSLHHWLNLTLATGGVLVVFGVIITMLGAWRRKPQSCARETQTSAQT